LKFRNGGFLSGLTMWSPQRQDGPTKIIGPAYTVKYVPVDDPEPKYPTHYVRSYLGSLIKDNRRPALKVPVFEAATPR